MANICCNDLQVITGHHSLGTEFLTKLRRDGFGGFIPEPADSDSDWRLRHWGDKWDILDGDSEFDIEHLRCQFTTAYTPPTAWFRHIATLYPALTVDLRYEESGEHLWGWMRSEDGILTVATEEPTMDQDDGTV